MADILFGFIVLCSPAFALQEPTIHKDDTKTTEKDEEEILVDSRVVLKRVNSPSEIDRFHANFELPKLEGGKKYSTNLTIFNPFSEPIQFSKVTMSCGCGKMAGTVQEIPALGEATFQLKLNVNDGLSRASAQTVYFHRLDDPSSAVLTLRYTYEVGGVFGFVWPRIDLEVLETEKDLRVRVPFRVISPITLDRLVLEWSDNLSGMNFRIVEDEEDSSLFYVVGEGRGDLIPRKGLVGQLLLRCPDVGRESQVQVIISHQELFTLRPESLRLTRDNQTSSYHATAMLRISPLQGAEVEQAADSDDLVETQTKKPGSPPKVDLTIGGEKATVTLKQMGKSGIYRLDVHFAKELESTEETINVRWRIVYNDVERIVNSQAFLPSR